MLFIAFLKTNESAFNNINKDAKEVSVSHVLEVIQGYYIVTCNVHLL